MLLKVGQEEKNRQCTRMRTRRDNSDSTSDVSSVKRNYSVEGETMDVQHRMEGRNANGISSIWPKKV